ncbi:MAG: RsiV family protein, partial [Acidobacteriota bacterium]
NYKAWVITKKGLWIVFDPYQVASYAAGPQTVLVPYSVLKDIIKPDGPVAALAK